MKENCEIKVKASDNYLATRAKIEETKAKIEETKQVMVEKINRFIKSYLATKKGNVLNVEDYVTTLNEDGFDFNVTLIGLNNNGIIYVRGHYDNGTKAMVELKSEPQHYESFLILFNTIHIIITTNRD